MQPSPNNMCGARPTCNERRASNGTPMRDLRLAVLALRATPIVSVVAILSLALGIGANTAVFSLVNSLLLQSLPVRQPQQLVMLSDGINGDPQSWTYPIWNQVRTRPQLFD